MADNKYKDAIENPTDTVPYRDDTAEVGNAGKDGDASLHVTNAASRFSLHRVLYVACCFIVTLLIASALSAFFFLTFKSTSRDQPVVAGQPQGNQQEHNKEPIAYNLDFPALYPELSSGASPECSAAWSTLNSVPCHDQVFDHNTDNGTLSMVQAYSWELLYVLPRICEERCGTALREAFQLISASCGGSDDRFELSRYDGMFYPAYLQSGPWAEVRMLLQRHQHLCRSSPDNDSDYDYCVAELYDRFSIIDGVNANQNLFKGIAAFMEQTDTKRTEPAHRKTGSVGSALYFWSYDFPVREQSYGPGEGETTCGYCLFDYFSRTLQSWTPNSMRYPETRVTVSLPEFIRRVSAAGRRCSPTEKWDEIYQSAIAQYQQAGLLTADGETTRPPRDLTSLIINGPSASDSPVLEIHAELERLSSPDFNVTDPENFEGNKACLSGLEAHYTSAKCYINLSRDELAGLLAPDRKVLRAAFCSEECRRSFDDGVFLRGCSGVKLMPVVEEFVGSLFRASLRRSRYCNAVKQRPLDVEWDCAAALLNINHSEWALDQQPATPVFLAGITKALDELEAKPVPEEIRQSLASDSHRFEYEDFKEALALDPAFDYQRVTGLERAWLKELGASVCAGCIWNRLSGPTMKGVMDYMREAPSVSEYVDVVKRYHSVCTSRGATWLGGTPHGDDPYLWRLKDEKGNVMRYIGGPGHSHSYSPLWVYGVNEAYGKVDLIGGGGSGNIPGTDIGSLWHVLQAARTLEAEARGEYDFEWLDMEEKHREKADREIWKIEWGSVSYIGPRGGLGEKTG